MRIVMKNMSDMSENIYEYVDDALRDIISENDEMVEKFIDEFCSPIDILGFRFAASSVLKKCLDEKGWDTLVEDFILSERDYLIEELRTENEVDYWGYKLINLEND